MEPASKPDFRALFEACPGLYLVLLPNSPDFTIVAASNAYLHATKTKRENIINKGIFTAFPDNPKDPNATGVRNLRTSLERVVVSKTFDVMAVQKYDITRPEYEGGGFEEKYWSPTNTPVLGDNQEILYIIHRVEDVTELIHLKQKGLEQEKTREEEVQRKELEILARAKEREDAHSSGQLARIILERMYQFVALFDADGRFLEINKPALDGSGLPKSEVLGHYLWEVSPWKVSEDNPKKVHNAFLKATKGEFVREELELWAGAGGTQKITIDFSLIPIRDEQGKIAYYLGEGRNITEKKLAEAEIERKNIQLNQLNERLKALDQLKTQFFANVSHELRTPLTLILGPAEKVREDENLTSEQKQELEVIIRNGRLLLKHVNDLLDVARLEAGKITPSYVKFNLSMLIKSMASNFEGLARDKHIDFNLEVVDLALEADPNMVQRVLLNLISNAFKFTPKGGCIRILATCQDEEVLISVKDTGQGVAIELRESIFERFKQGEDPMTKSFAGTGLGLAIAKEFVELHQGSIAVSGDPGQGAIFTVRLPLKAPAHVVLTKEVDTTAYVNQVVQSLAEFKEISKEIKQPSKLQSSRGLVLVVEDNADLNRFLTDILSSEFNVECAFDGEEGLQKAISLKPDLILSDIMMPKMSGDQMVAEIRKLPELDVIPVMLLTAKADEQLRIQLLKGGAQDYVLKPFFSEEILARVNNLVAIKRVREHLQQDLESTEKDLQVLAREVSKNRGQLKAKADELEKLNVMLQDSIHVRDEFLSIASHELKTPVSALKLQLEMVDRKIKPQVNQMPSVEALKKSFEMSLRQVDIFVNLINNLLDVSKIRLGRMVLEPELFNLSSVVKETFEGFSAQFSFAKCHAQLMMEEDIYVEWDQMRIKEILANLFSNAVKYAPGKPVKVSVNCCSDQKAVILTIEDQGPGIARGSQGKIFERFGRTSPPTHTSGMGLGLFIVRNLVEAHQGTIRLESDEGRGTKFIVEIPLKPEMITKKEMK